MLVYSTITVLSFAAFFSALAFAAGFRFETAGIYSVGLGLMILSFCLIFFGFFQGWSSLTGPGRNMVVVGLFGVVTFATPVWLLTQAGGMMEAGYAITSPSANPARLSVPKVIGPMVTIRGDEPGPYLLVTEDEARLSMNPIYPPFEAGDSTLIAAPSDLPKALDQVIEEVDRRGTPVYLYDRSRLVIAIDRDAPFSRLNTYLSHVPETWNTRVVVYNGAYGTTYIARISSDIGEIPQHEGPLPVVHLDGQEIDIAALKRFEERDGHSGFFKVRADDDVPVQQVIDVMRVQDTKNSRLLPLLEVQAVSTEHEDL